MEGKNWERTYINGETAIKPYYYVRNGLLHVRYTVDRCLELSENEERRLHAQMTDNPSDKQGVLAREWQFQSGMVGKAVIYDGIAETDRRVHGNGRKNQGRHV